MLAAAWLHIVALGAGAAVFHVDDDAVPGGDGLTWATAFDTLEAALAAADANGVPDDLWVAAGVYRAPPGGWTLGNLRLFGGFAGTESLLSERVLGVNETVLTGDQLGNDVPLSIGGSQAAVPALNPPPEFSDNSAQILSMNIATIDGVTVTGVSTPGGAACAVANSTVRNCLFRDNFGGALISLGNAIVSKSTFVRGVTTTKGAAIAQVFGVLGAPPVRVYNCRFHQNYSLSGGVVAATHHGVLLANCVFTGNLALQGGAAVHVNQLLGSTPGAAVDLFNCTIVRNEQLVANSGDSGVAVYTQSLLGSGQVRVRNSIVTQNVLAGSGANAVGVFDIARAATGTGGVVNHLVERCLAAVGTNISPSAPINQPGVAIPAPGFEALSGDDAIVGTMDDQPRLMPRVTPCIDRAQAVSLPADEADLDSDGNTSEPLPIDFNGLPRVFDDPDVLGPTGGTLDAGAAELQSSAGMLVVQTSPTPIDPDTAVFSRLLDPIGTRLSNAQPTGVATVQLSESTLPACVISGLLTMDRVSISTPGDIWLGDPAGSFGGIRFDTDLPPGMPLLTCRSLEFRSPGSSRFLRPVSIIATSGMRIGPGAVLAFSKDFDLVGQVFNAGGVLLARTTGLVNRATITSGGFTQLVTGGPEDPAPLISLWADVNGSNASLVCDGPLFLQGSIELTIDGEPTEGPRIGQSWTLLTGSSRSGLFDTAFLPGWADRLTRLVYASAGRSSTVVAQVESRDNVVALDPPLGFPVPGTPRAAAAGKVHAAAHPNPDLAVVVPDESNPASAPGTLHVLLNLGNTATAWNGYAAVTITRATGIDPSGVVIAELTGDGRNDIAVTNRGSDTVRVFINNGADEFPTFSDFSTATAPRALAAADFDDDGDTDLAVAALDATALVGVVQVYMNNGAGEFVLDSQTPLGSDPTALIAVDLDNQSGPDLAVADTGDDRVAVLFNGGVVFRAWQGFQLVRHFVCDDEPSSIQPGNIDNGKDETLVTSNTGMNANSVTVLRPGPGGPESDGYTSASGPIGESPRSLALLDLNNDGLDDIVAVATAPGGSQATLRVLVAGFDEAANVQFTQGPDIVIPTPPTLVLAADLDADGSNDVVTVGPGTVAGSSGGDGEPARGAGLSGAANNIAAVLTRPPCPGDFNNDAVRNVSDLTFFLGRFSQTASPGTPAFRADFNGDGVVNTPDLILFLGRFAQPCP